MSSVIRPFIFQLTKKVPHNFYWFSHIIQSNIYNLQSTNLDFTHLCLLNILKHKFFVGSCLLTLRKGTQGEWISETFPYSSHPSKPSRLSVQLLSHVQLFAISWTAAHEASLSITNSWDLFKLMSIESVMLFNHLILCCPLLPPPSIFPSIKVFSSESVLYIRWPKYWSFSISISPSNEYSGLICFRVDWLDLLAVQGTLESLLQHHSSKASIFQHSVFLTVQLSHPYMTTGKTRALTRWTFVGKVMSLLFNIVSRLVITFLPRSKRLFFFP